MIALGIATGVFVFLLTGGFLSQMMLHNNEAVFWPSVVAGIWAAWPVVHYGRLARQNFLHPPPREYNIPVKHAFAKMRDLLADTSYNYGDKWHVSTADTQGGRINADLRFFDEEDRLEADFKGNVHSRKVRLQRYIGLEVTICDTGRDTTLIGLDFNPKAEGYNPYACDSIIAGLICSIENQIGPGGQSEDSPDTKLPAPPWWLIWITALALVAFFIDIQKAIFQ